NTARLEGASWITADLVVRRGALQQLSGFDERFRRAFREDADLALRMAAAGWALTRGRRTTVHPVRPAPWWVSVRMQAGNADDVLMRRLHGPGWRQRAGERPSRQPRHIAVVVLGLAAILGLLTKRRAFPAVAAGGWLAATAAFAWERIAPGPRSPREIG